MASLQLSSFPALSEVTGGHLMQAIKRTPKSKAPGADGWSYQDVRDWPPPLLGLVATFYSAVEAKGQWLAGLL